MLFWSNLPQKDTILNRFIGQPLDPTLLGNMLASQLSLGTPVTKITKWQFKALCKRKFARSRIEQCCDERMQNWFRFRDTHARMATTFTKTAARILSFRFLILLKLTQWLSRRWNANKKRAMHTFRVSSCHGQRNSLQPFGKYCCLLMVRETRRRGWTMKQSNWQGTAPLKCFCTKVGKLPLPSGYICFLGRSQPKFIVSICQWVRFLRCIHVTLRKAFPGFLSNSAYWNIYSRFVETTTHKKFLLPCFVFKTLTRCLRHSAVNCTKACRKRSSWFGPSHTESSSVNSIRASVVLSW